MTQSDDQTDSAPITSPANQPTTKPRVPEGKFVQLGERGTVLVRDFGGKPGAPVVVLLHGWTASAVLNWFTCYHTSYLAIF